MKSTTRWPALSITLFALGACTVDHGGLLPPELYDAGPEFDGGMDAGRDVGTDTLPRDAGMDVPAVDAAECAPRARFCRDDQIIICEEGRLVVAETCRFGCSTIDLVCNPFEPTNAPPDIYTQGTLEAVWTTDVVINTDSGAIFVDGLEERGAGEGLIGGVHFSRLAQPGGPPLALFAFRSIELASSAKLQTQGTAALLMAADGTILIDGVIDVGALGRTPGPGGGSGGQDTSGGGPGAGNYSCSSDREGVFLDVHAAGGSGGGHAGRGGDGGEEGPASTAGGGPINDSEGTPLIGGGGGGSGGDCDGVDGGDGGGGGGAIQLTSNTRISVGGTIRSPGDAGREGDRAGGGGGAGGTIFLEAPTVTVRGSLVANGGSGGEGGDGANGQRGTDLAALTPSPPLGGDGGGGDTNDGGSGADDPDDNDGDDGASGGGGAAGRVLLRAQDLDTGAATISPFIGAGSFVLPL